VIVKPSAASGLITKVEPDGTTIVEPVNVRELSVDKSTVPSIVILLFVISKSPAPNVTVPSIVSSSI
jgi:hypothetical protein